MLKKKGIFTSSDWGMRQTQFTASMEMNESRELGLRILITLNANTTYVYNCNDLAWVGSSKCNRANSVPGSNDAPGILFNEIIPEAGTRNSRTNFITSTRAYTSFAHT